MEIGEPAATQTTHDVGWLAAARVGDLEMEAIANGHVLNEADVEVDLATFGSRLDGIAQQVVESTA